MAVTHLRKVELVGKPHVVQADKAGVSTTVHQLNLNLRGTAPHAARARALGITRAHMTGIATMLRYLSTNRDHTLSSTMLGAGGLLGRITR